MFVVLTYTSDFIVYFVRAQREALSKKKCTVLVGPWPPQSNVASDLYPGHPPANFYKPVYLGLPAPHQSILLSVGHLLIDLQVLSIISL